MTMMTERLADRAAQEAHFDGQGALIEREPEWTVERARQFIADAPQDTFVMVATTLVKAGVMTSQEALDALRKAEFERWRASAPLPPLEDLTSVTVEFCAEPIKVSDIEQRDLTLWPSCWVRPQTEEHETTATCPPEEFAVAEAEPIDENLSAVYRIAEIDGQHTIVAEGSYVHETSATDWLDD